LKSLLNFHSLLKSLEFWFQLNHLSFSGRKIVLFACIYRIYVFLKRCSIGPIVPFSVSDGRQGNNAGVTVKEPWFRRPDVAAEAALCPHKSMWSLTAQEPPVKEKSQIF